MPELGDAQTQPLRGPLWSRASGPPDIDATRRSLPPVDFSRPLGHGAARPRARPGPRRAPSGGLDRRVSIGGSGPRASEPGVSGPPLGPVGLGTGRPRAVGPSPTEPPGADAARGRSQHEPPEQTLAERHPARREGAIECFGEVVVQVGSRRGDDPRPLACRDPVSLRLDAVDRGGGEPGRKILRQGSDQRKVYRRPGGVTPHERHEACPARAAAFDAARESHPPC